jgi:hypothetical protein
MDGVTDPHLLSMVLWKSGLMVRGVAMSAVLIAREAEAVYLDLDDRCERQYRSHLTAKYVADEVRRIVLAISTDPAQDWLQRYRTRGEGGFRFAVIIPTPTGFDYDAAVFWRFRGDGRAAVLAIQLEYER